MRLIDADELLKKSYSMDFAEDIEQAPTVDAVPVVHAHWIKETKGEQKGMFRCSNCNRNWIDEVKYIKYCNNCGAKMDEEEK